MIKEEVKFKTKKLNSKQLKEFDEFVKKQERIKKMYKYLNKPDLSRIPITN